MDELRRRWDPRMAARIEPHVTILYEVDDVERLQVIVAATEPLHLRATDIQRWEAEPGGLYLQVEDPYGDLQRLRSAFVGAECTPYRPHITVLHRDSVTAPGQVDRAWAALRDRRLDADFLVRDLVLYEEAGGAWRQVGRPRFGAEAT